MTFHQGRYVTVLRAANEIAFPMTGNGAVRDFCGPFPDGDGIDDLTSGLSADTRVLRAAYAAFQLARRIYQLPRISGQTTIAA